MKKKYFLDSTYRVALISRFLAKGIDLFLALIISTFEYPIGYIISLAYISFADGLKNGQSIGKKLMGFSVISLDDGSACNYRKSIIRNLPFVIPFVFFIIPLWGWAFAMILGIPLFSLEVYLLSKLDSGFRLGDVMADTTVHAIMGHSSPKKFNSHWFKSEDNSENSES